MALIGPGTCSGCGACVATCPTRALRPAPGGPSVLDRVCTGCLDCLDICPVDALAEVG